MEETGRSGFTLLELLITLALVVVLAGVAVPSMAAFMDKARLRSAAQALAQELQAARNHALTYQQSVYFSVSVSPGSWCYGWRDAAACDCRSGAPQTDSCGSDDKDRQRSDTGQTVDSSSVQLNTSRSDASRTLRFSPVRGTASADTFVLSNDAGELRVVVSPLGRVRICSPDARGYARC